MLFDLKFKPNRKYGLGNRSIDKDNVQGISKRASNDYKENKYVYIFLDGKYHKLEGDKQEPPTKLIMEVFTNGTIRLQKGVMNKHNNIFCLLTPHFGDLPI